MSIRYQQYSKEIKHRIPKCEILIDEKNPKREGSRLSHTVSTTYSTALALSFLSLSLPFFKHTIRICKAALFRFILAFYTHKNPAVLCRCLRAQM